MKGLTQPAARAAIAALCDVHPIPGTKQPGQGAQGAAQMQVVEGSVCQR